MSNFGFHEIFGSCFIQVDILDDHVSPKFAERRRMSMSPLCKCSLMFSMDLNFDQLNRSLLFSCVSYMHSDPEWDTLGKLKFYGTLGELENEDVFVEVSSNGIS